MKKLIYILAIASTVGCGSKNGVPQSRPGSPQTPAVADEDFGPIEVSISNVSKLIEESAIFKLESKAEDGDNSVWKFVGKDDDSSIEIEGTDDSHLSRATVACKASPTDRVYGVMVFRSLFGIARTKKFAAWYLDTTPPSEKDIGGVIATTNIRDGALITVFRPAVVDSAKKP